MRVVLCCCGPLSTSSPHRVLSFSLTRYSRPNSYEIHTRLCSRAPAVTLYPCHSQSAHYKTAVRAPADVITAVMSLRIDPATCHPCTPRYNPLRHQLRHRRDVTSDADGAEQRRSSIPLQLEDGGSCDRTGRG